MSDKITVWIGVCSSIITIILSVMNFNLNAEMQEIDAYVKKVEADLKQKTFELEKSKKIHRGMNLLINSCLIYWLMMKSMLFLPLI